jgi:LDH2 family malate/lactate/ureidoglycolate dehydrogenase
MTNTTKLVAPLRGAERMLGTNPIAIGFPAEPEPIIVDMATCAAAYGKIEIAKRAGKSIPDGWAIDDSGLETDDPNAMIQGGALLPLGSRREQGGHKGYCLAIAVDLLCGVLSGANWGPFCPPFALRQEIPGRSVGKGIGHFFGAMDVAGFIDPDEFRRQTADFISTLRSTRPAPGTDGPLIPGDPERDALAYRLEHGVPVVQRVVDDLTDVARRRGVPLPEPLA